MSAILTAGPKVRPPSVDLKITSLMTSSAPWHSGSSTWKRSAATYRVPEAGSTMGWAPRYWVNEQPSSSECLAA